MARAWKPRPKQKQFWLFQYGASLKRPLHRRWLAIFLVLVSQVGVLWRFNPIQDIQDTLMTLRLTVHTAAPIGWSHGGPDRR